MGRLFFSAYGHCPAHSKANSQQAHAAPPVPGEVPEAEWSEVKALPPPAGILPAPEDAPIFEALFGLR